MQRPACTIITSHNRCLATKHEPLNPVNEDLWGRVVLRRSDGSHLVVCTSENEVVYLQDEVVYLKTEDQVVYLRDEVVVELCTSETRLCTSETRLFTIETSCVTSDEVVYLIDEEEYEVRTAQLGKIEAEFRR
ncbi:unnamed protein product [Boreogadus saida]